MSATLPKPARVEKWQRWRNEMGEVLVLAIEPSPIVSLGDFARLANGYGIRQTREFLDWPEWTFLGYANPDKVEAGQRWGMRHKEYVVAMVLQNGEQALLDRTNPNAESGTSGRVSRASRGLLEASEWEYLGMAEGASIDGSAVEAAVVGAARAARDIAKALPGTEAAELDRLHTDIHANDKCVPITKKVDPKSEARRANEEAAKRLIANPPDWAYPRAWMCAVLAEVERSRGVAYQLNCYRKTGAATLAIKDYHFARLAGKTHEAAMLCVELNHHIVEVYARGMVKPAGLMGRPGVKGGISTCDLGVDYE